MARKVRGRKRAEGLGRVAKAAARGGKAEWVKLEDGDEKVLRVLDTGKAFKDAEVHRVPFEGRDGDTIHIDVPCLDQDDDGTPCPGCKDDLQRRYKFWTNVIERGDEDAAEPEDREDKIKIFAGGITIARRLDKLDARHDLGSRDIIVSRTGKGKKNTRYEVEWFDEESTPLTAEDKKLAEKKHDIVRYSKPPEYDDFYKAPWDDDDDDEDGEAPAKRGSGFSRRRKKDEEEEGPRRTSARRRSSKSSDSDSDTPKLKSFGSKSKSSGNSGSKTTVRRRRTR